MLLCRQEREGGVIDQNLDLSTCMGAASAITLAGTQCPMASDADDRTSETCGIDADEYVAASCQDWLDRLMPLSDDGFESIIEGFQSCGRAPEALQAYQEYAASGVAGLKAMVCGVASSCELPTQDDYVLDCDRVFDPKQVCGVDGLRKCLQSAPRDEPGVSRECYLLGVPFAPLFDACKNCPHSSDGQAEWDVVCVECKNSFLNVLENECESVAPIDQCFATACSGRGPQGGNSTTCEFWVSDEFDDATWAEGGKYVMDAIQSHQCVKDDVQCACNQCGPHMRDWPGVDESCHAANTVQEICSVKGLEDCFDEFRGKPGVTEECYELGIIVGNQFEGCQTCDPTIEGPDDVCVACKNAVEDRIESRCKVKSEDEVAAVAQAVRDVKDSWYKTIDAGIKAEVKASPDESEFTSLKDDPNYGRPEAGEYTLGPDDSHSLSISSEDIRAQCLVNCNNEHGTENDETKKCAATCFAEHSRCPIGYLHDASLTIADIVHDIKVGFQSMVRSSIPPEFR